MNEYEATMLIEDSTLNLSGSIEPEEALAMEMAEDNEPEINEPDSPPMDEEVPAEETPAADPSTDELHAEIDRLRAELEETKALHARMATELGEFHTLFPEVNASSIPESIWEQVKNGIPLAASYALYEKKCILAREHAERVNLRNAKKTPGAAGKNTPSEYFSPDEVRAMSQAEVRSNYQKILESMKKWNS